MGWGVRVAHVSVPVGQCSTCPLTSGFDLSEFAVERWVTEHSRRHDEAYTAYNDAVEGGVDFDDVLCSKHWLMQPCDACHVDTSG